MRVMSGSDRDKLLSLVNTAASPFHVSKIQRMPPLGAGLHGACSGPTVRKWSPLAPPSVQPPAL